MADELPVPIPGFKGLNNKEDRTKLGLEWLEVADNIIIGEMNDVSRRPGSTQSLTGVLDMYASRDGKRGFVINSSNALLEFDGDNTYQLLSDVGKGPYRWTDAENMTFVLGSERGFVIYPDRAEPWGITPPSRPTLTAVPGGLPAGAYQVVASFVNEHDRDSGAVAASRIDLMNSSSAIQAEIDSVPSGYTVRWWMSSVDGVDLYLAAETTESHVVLNGPLMALTIPLKTQFFDVPPVPALQIAFWLGRVWVAYHDSVRGFTRLIPSQPLDYHYFAYDDADCIDVQGRVTLLAGAGAGLLVGTDRAVHVYDANANKTTIAGYGAVESQAKFDDNERCWFWTTHGVCAFPEFQNLTEAVLSVSPGQRAAVVVRESGGEQHVIIAPSTGDEPAYNSITQTISVQ